MWFENVLCYKIEVGIYEKFGKMCQQIQEKITCHSNFAASKCYVVLALWCKRVHSLPWGVVMQLFSNYFWISYYTYTILTAIFHVFLVLLVSTDFPSHPPGANYTYLTSSNHGMPGLIIKVDQMLFSDQDKRNYTLAEFIHFEHLY